MTKSIQEQTQELQLELQSDIFLHSNNQELTNRKSRMKHILYRQLIFTNPKDCLRQKKVKNSQGLYEKEAFLVPFSNVRRKLLILSRSSAQKQTMHIHLEFTSMNEATKVLTRIMPKHSNIRGLYLYFSEDVGFEFWKKLSSLIQRFSHLTSLIIAFRQKKPEMSDRDLITLTRSVSMLTRLTSLCLALIQNEAPASKSGYLRAGFILNSNHKTEGILARMVSRLKKLKATGLNIIEQDSITDAGLDLYGKALFALPNMQDISLRLLDCRRVAHQGFNKFLEYLQANPKMKKVALSFTICERYSEPEHLPLMHPIWASKNLQHISFEMKLIGLFPPDMLEAAATAIEKIRSLGRLILIFQGTHCRINTTVEYLLSICAKMPSLTEVSLSFISCVDMDYLTANNIIYGLNSCPHLKKASLEFVSCFKRVMNEAIEIKAPLCKRPHLKELTLSFIDCTDLKEYQMERIVELLEQSENLEALTLKVNWCKSFLNSHFQKVIQAISRMEYLQRMTVGLEGCDKITSESGKPFGKMISQLPRLKYLDINFSYFPLLTDQNMKSMGETISILKNLEGLKIAVRNCPKVTDEGIKMLCNSFVGLRKLGTIMLCWSSNNVRELSKTLMGHLGKTLPDLYCVDLHAVKKNGQVSKVCIRLTD